MSEHPSSAEAAITFRPLTPADLPLMHRWRNNPVVTRWWNAVPDYTAIEAKYTPRIAGSDPVHPYIALCDDVAVGYLQWCHLAEVPGHAAEGLAGPGAAAVDLFIGEDAYRGRGIGAAMLRAFLRDIIFVAPGVQRCYIDPHPENAVAIRSYSRVGFRALNIIARDAEDEPSWLMEIDRAAVVTR